MTRPEIHRPAFPSTVGLGMTFVAYTAAKVMPTVMARIYESADCTGNRDNSKFTEMAAQRATEYALALEAKLREVGAL